MKSTNPRRLIWTTLARRTMLVLCLFVALFAAFTAFKASKRVAAIEADLPPEGQILDVDGVKIHAVVMGDGPDVVLIHGSSGNTRDWTTTFAPELAKTYRVTVFDRPGLGYSQDVSAAARRAFGTKSASLTEQAAVLKKAADQLGVERPIVLGHSFGGAIALAWALDHAPAGVVTVGGVSNTYVENLWWLNRINASRFGGALFVPLATAFVPQDFVDGSIQNVFKPAPAPEGYADWGGVDLVIRPSAARANARQVANLLPQITAMETRYSELSLPIEVVHGTADTIVPAKIHAEVFATQVDSANVTLIDGMGHMPHHTHADVVFAAIDRAAKRAGLR